MSKKTEHRITFYRAACNTGAV